MIGKQLYQQLADGYPQTTDFVGEWIFSQSAKAAGESFTAALSKTLHRRGSTALEIENFVSALALARAAVPKFVSDCATDILNLSPTIVGITSTFQQHQASIALAVEIKRRCPEVIIVVGGANCEGEMGWQTAHAYDAIDIVVSGEGDHAFPLLVESICSGRGIPQVNGVYSRLAADGLSREPQDAYTSIVDNLDELPPADYSHYFAQAERYEHLLHRQEIRLPIETSRGCWWGEKNHCTFCGLNGHGMKFRSKSAKTAIQEFTNVSQKYLGVRLSAVDNILDYRYFDEVVPALTKIGLKGQAFDIFYEVKANIRIEKLRMLKDAGISNIQPGIESLSSPVLHLMRKGIKAVHNIQLLKNCRELSITPHWNLIWGFPGEGMDEYTKMAELIPSIHHLIPPGGVSQIRLDRFSPNFKEAARFGFTNVRPYNAYQHLYDLHAKEVGRLAYFFEYDYGDGRNPREYTELLVKAAKEWKHLYATAELFYLEQATGMLVLDLRTATVLAYNLTSSEAMILTRCHQAQPVPQVEAMARELGPDGLTSLQRLLRARLLLSLDEFYLSLPLSLEVVQPKPLALRLLADSIEGDGIYAVNLN